MYYIVDNGQAYLDHTIYFIEISNEDIDSFGKELIEKLVLLPSKGSEVIAVAEELKFRNTDLGLPYNLYIHLGFDNFLYKYIYRTDLEDIEDVRCNNKEIFDILPRKFLYKFIEYWKDNLNNYYDRFINLAYPHFSETQRKYWIQNKKCILEFIEKNVIDLKINRKEIMNHKQYTEAVEKKEYPKDPICPLGSKFINDAGEIQNIIEKCSLNSIAIITSKKGSQRSNHWHKQGDHFLYCMSGSLIYYERDIDSEEYQMYTIKQGMMFYTPPRKVHLTVFLEDTVLLSLGSNPRSHEDHENDLVREKFF